MTEILQRIKDAVDGYKTYITAMIGVLTALLAWSNGELSDLAFLGAVWVATQVCFIRSGNKKDVTNQLGSINMEAAREIHKEGFHTGWLTGYEQGDEDARYEDE